MMRLPYPLPKGMGSWGNISSLSLCDHLLDDCDYVHNFYIIALPILLIIVVVGFVTNVLVLFIIVTNKKMRSVPNCYVANICIVDIIFLTMASLTSVIEYAFGVADIVMSIIPRSVIVYFQLVLTNATCAMLCALAFDRYLAIVHPFRFNRYRTVKVAFIVGVVAWFVSFAVCTPLYAGEVILPTNRTSFQFHDYLLAIVISCVFSYAVPLLVIACCYVAILYSLFKKASPLRNSACFTQGLESRMLKRNLTVLKSVLIIALVFAVNYGVFYALYLWLSICSPHDFRRAFVASHIAFFMESLGICLNPVIYGLMQPNFRPYLKNILCARSKQTLGGHCCEKRRNDKEVQSNMVAKGTKETSITESRNGQLDRL